MLFTYKSKSNADEVLRVHYIDENVDMKVATYISYLREHFRMERSYSNQRMH